MSQPADPPFYIGTSNITLPVANKAAFPESFKNASRLSYYASLFNSLEVNSSFYKIPQPKTVARWTEEVPADFRFTFKLNRELTHGKSTLPDADLVKQFMTTINAARAKAGSLLVQFPAGRTHDAAFLERLLGLIGKDNPAWDICIEFRHPTWYRDSIYRMLEKQGAAIVIHDKPGAGPALSDPPAGFAYYRFHGPKGNYKGSYEFETLDQRAQDVRNLLEAGQKVYTYFNNTAGTAVFDALAFQELVTGKVTFEP